MIAIVDYGLGNIKAFGNIYKRLNIPYFYAQEASQLKSATHIILPGVGSFDHAMDCLTSSGLRETLDELVLSKRIPVLGICVGMQIMATSSDEGAKSGLGWLETNVKKFDIKPDLPLPHMGWNNIERVAENPLLCGLDKVPRFYFLHSYHFDSHFDGVIATAEYADSIGCIVNQDNIYGIQCHPEKSHHNGVALLKNFAEVNHA
ncbi:imidazole glycerol phosphate synthase subunit HisH [Vibrio sp.]|uniref:imidazole glycerol phosphate synthase subunit HisH n=1 Tax=Vibrio sp. TaxID=678 RepID=UPI003F6BDF92